MLNHTLIVVLILLFNDFVFPQTELNITAKNNFLQFFEEFKNLYPADQSSYEFTEFSELDSIEDFPQDFYVILEFQDRSYYERGIKIERYDSLIILPDTVISLYNNLRKRINYYAENVSNISENEKLINEFRILMETHQKPHIGYYQTALMSQKLINGNTNNSTIYIVFRKDLSIKDFLIPEN